MPWHVHFGGDRLTAVDDATFEKIRDQIIEAGRHGATARVELRTATRRIELLWTPGAPIYFEHSDD